MKKEIESVKKTLAAKDAEYNEAIRASRKDIAELEAKIAELEKKAARPESLEDYKITAQELRDSRNYLEYLRIKVQKYAGGRLLNDSEYKEIKKTLTAEMEQIQAKAAPEVEQAVLQAVEVLKAYCCEISELESLLTHAERQYTPNGAYSSKNWYAGISDYSTNRVRWIEKFVWMYINYADEAQRLEKPRA